MPAALAAAHVGHEIEHSKAMFGFIAGAVVGLAIGVVVVATAGGALGVMAAVGAAVAATGGMALTGKYIGEAERYTNPSGPISEGSPNVFYGPAKMPAARTALDLVACKNHGPKMIALGSDSVFINTSPAARRTDKTECDGTLGSLMDHIFIGAETAQYLEIESEVPDWMVQIAQGMVIVGTAVALVFGAAAAAVAGGICGVISFAGTTIASLAGGYLGAIALGSIGEALFGETGRRWGEAIGGLGGGIFGARIGNRLSTGHPVDVATGELFTSDVDFVIPGLIPIVWERFWISSSTQSGQLGHKWHHPYDMMIVEGTDFNILRMEHGRLIPIPRLRPDDTFYHRAEKLTVIRDRSGEYAVLTQDKLRLTFVTSDIEPSRHVLHKISDFNNNRLTLAYTNDGHLSKITNSGGIVLHFDLDPLGRITGVHKTSGDETIPLIQYHYDGDGNLATATNATGVPFSYHYANQLIRQETRRSGLSFYFEWDDLDRGRAARCVKTWGDDNIYYRDITYDTDERRTKVIDSRGHETTYLANAIGLVTQITTPLGHVTTQRYNVFAELQKIEDPNGNRLSSTHDDFGRVIRFTDKDGATTTYAFASDDPTSPNFHSIQTETNPLGHTTRIAYDTAGNIASISDPLRNSVGYLRDERGLPLAIRDEAGTLARFSWSPEGALTQERTSAGGTLGYSYDRFGRIISEQRESEGMTQYAYDARDQLIQVLNPDNTKTQLTYDVEGNVTAFTDAAGRTTAWHFGTCPFPQRRRNPDGSEFAYAYDSELNLVALRNEVHETYALAYDADGNLTQQTGFDGRVQTFQYDGAGHVTLAVDGHRQHRFTRDPLGRLIERHSSDGASASFAYDAAGQMIAANNAARKLGFAYDQRGLLIEETQDSFRTTHAYSGRGQRTATVLPDGRFVKFGYDQDGGFASLRFMDRDVLDVQRDRLGREKTRTSGKIVQKTDYDPQGRIKQQQAYRDERQNPIFGRAYGYDPAGLINEIRDSARGVSRYQYDAREQLRAVSGDRPEVFAFDPAGNILGNVANPNDASVSGGRLMMQGDNHYTYDDAGNRVRLERGWGGVNAFDYGYDDQNQLTSIVEKAPGRLKTTHFSYDALGRRVSKHYREDKRVPEAANVVPPPDDERPETLIREETTWFLWNGDVLLAEGRGDTSGAADPLALVYIYEPDSFRPAAQIRRVDPDAQGQVYIYWLDHLGTPQEITNEAGELVWQVALKAWGGIDRVYVEQVGNALRFQGQYHDVETGLHYNRFRHYDPAVGCFINQDPIGLLGGEQSSLYGPNTLVWVDPLGLNRWTDWLRANPGQTTARASPGYQAAYPPVPSTGTVHGNSHASTRPTVGYIIRENGTNRILKFGETSNANPQARYTQKWYTDNNAYMDPVKAGTKAEMHRWQSERIRQYENRRGVKPSLNKCYF